MEDLLVLSIQLLGNFRLLDGAQPITAVRSRRLQALLAYLLLDPDLPIPRARIAAAFWPETTDAQARTNLRNLIHALRTAWPHAGQYLLVDSWTLSWNTAAPCRLDVTEFEAAAAARDISGLRAATDLYTGDLLPDLYDEWLESERLRLRSLYSDTLERLAGLLEASDRYSEAVAVAERLILLDPLQELHHVRLMRLHALSGNRDAVRRAYRALTNSLREELDIEPDAATQDAYEEWLRYRPASAPPRAARGTNLPAQLTSFIGRRREVAEVLELLRRPAARLVTLTGAGGSGKTRLALEVAAGQVDDYADGVWFVELAPLSDPALAASAVASALGIVESEGWPLLDALVSYLRDRHLLLLLDNCEHLMAEVVRLADTLLRRCPQLRILATSREPLGIAGEAVRLTPPLSLPPPDEQPSVETLAQYDAIRLFVERATAALPSFALSEGNAAAVTHLCRQLDAMPLAIELAAARVGLLRVEQIVARLVDRFRFLAGGHVMPPRHQTLRALIDWSHDLLSPAEQRLFRRLSVFAGGFTLEAAEAVCDVNGEDDALELLTQLVNKSLVAADRVSGRETRYDLHETIREYAAEKLAKGGEALWLSNRHANHYFTQITAFKYPTPSAIAVFQNEFENIGRAAEHLLAIGRFDDMIMIYRMSAAQLFMGSTRLSLDRLRRVLEVKGISDRVRAWSLLWLGLSYQPDSGPFDLDAASRFLNQAEELARKSGFDDVLIEILSGQGRIANWKLNDGEKARRLWSEALAISQRLGLKDGEAVLLNNLANMSLILDGDYEEMRRLAQASSDLCRSLGLPWMTVPESLLVIYDLRIKATDHMRDRLLEITSILKAYPDTHGFVEFELTLLLWGLYALATGHHAKAVRLQSKVTALADPLFWLRIPIEKQHAWEALTTAHEVLDEEAFAAAWAEGKAMSLEEAIAFALEE